MNKINKTLLHIIIVVMLVSSLVPFAFAKKSEAPTGSDVAAYAKTFVGYPYRYGSSGPNSFDCGGFVSYVFRHFDITPPSGIKYYNNPTAMGTVVSEKDAKPGDIIAWSGHVGIYIGGGKVVHALNPRNGVCISNISTFRNRHGSSNPSHVYIRVDLENTDSKKAERTISAETARLESSFYAYVSSKDGKLTAADVNGNVALVEPSRSDSQLWHFVQQSDGTYSVINCGTGASWTMKAVEGAGTGNLVASKKYQPTLQSFEILCENGKYYFRLKDSDRFVSSENMGNNLSQSDEPIKKLSLFTLEFAEGAPLPVEHDPLSPSALTVHPLLKGERSSAAAGSAALEEIAAALSE